jgi:thymidylate synthase ThyX
MDMTANAQALINISRKRLCSCASKETREAWKQVQEAIREIDPIMASKMVPECIYRGFCPEFMNPCGYSKTEKYQQDLEKYRSTDYNQE